MEALFDCTTDVLNQNPDWESNEVAFQFRKLMTAGQTMQKHNEFRTSFYTNVAEKAEAGLAKYRAVCSIFLAITV